MRKVNTNQQADAARIGARIRYHIATADWAWRHAEPEDDIDHQAIERLRDEAARARRWLQMAADAIGMPLPLGNGTAGPWHRIAVLDNTAHSGVLDIAAGRIAWTDARVPSYVQRFTGSGEGRGVSSNLAGGTGGLPSDIRQVGLTYGDATPRISPLPRPVVTHVLYGLTTCYGTIEGPPTDNTYGVWGAHVGVPHEETTAPQEERWRPPGMSMMREVAEAIPRSLGHQPARIDIREGDVHHPGIRGEYELSVCGTSTQRAKTCAALDVAHEVVAEMYVRLAGIRARIEVGLKVELADRDQLRLGLRTSQRAVRQALAALKA